MCIFILEFLASPQWLVQQTSQPQRPTKATDMKRKEIEKTCWYKGRPTKPNSQRPNYKDHKKNFNQSYDRPSSVCIVHGNEFCYIFIFLLRSFKQYPGRLLVIKCSLLHRNTQKEIETKNIYCDLIRFGDSSTNLLNE